MTTIFNKFLMFNAPGVKFFILIIVFNNSVRTALSLQRVEENLA